MVARIVGTRALGKSSFHQTFVTLMGLRMIPEMSFSRDCAGGKNMLHSSCFHFSTHLIGVCSALIRIDKLYPRDAAIDAATHQSLTRVAPIRLDLSNYE